MTDLSTWIYKGAKLKASKLAKAQGFFHQDVVNNDLVMTVHSDDADIALGRVINLTYVDPDNGEVCGQGCAAGDALRYLEPAERQSVLSTAVRMMSHVDEL